MQLSNPVNLTHAQVVHVLQRCVRVTSPVFYKDPERAYILEILLKKRAGIKEVRSVPEIASVRLGWQHRWTLWSARGSQPNAAFTSVTVKAWN